MSIKTGKNLYVSQTGKIISKETTSFFHTDGVKPMPCTDIIISPSTKKAIPRDVSGFLKRMNKKYNIK